MLNRYWTDTSITIRLTYMMLAVSLFCIGSFIGIQKAKAASLRSVSVVTGDTLKLGDIFDNVGHNADYVIGAAPQPGKDMTLNARTLYRIASAMDLSWRPTSTNDHIIIRRDATLISYNDIQNTLRSALKEKGVHGNFNLKLNSGKPSITLPKEMEENIEITAMSYDRGRDYFKATLVAPSKENPIKKIDVSGNIERLTTVPVLNVNLQNGDVISARDIEMVEIPQYEVQHNMIANKEDMIGMTPRRMAYAGKFLQNGSLIKPQLVTRGEQVNITYAEGALTLSAKGKALQSGAKGDIVRVTNATSARTVDAVVTGQNEVIAR